MKETLREPEGSKEYEVSPPLPTSGQILGILSRTMEMGNPRLHSKTARRYFSGRLETLVKESSRVEIFGAISEALAELGVGAAAQTERAAIPSSALASTLSRHADYWDRSRVFLLPRMQRVLPSHLSAVWLPYVRLAAIDLALRLAAHMHLTETSPNSLNFLNWISCDRRGRYLNARREEAGLTLASLAEEVEVDGNTVEAWMYKGTRPSDEHLVRISEVLAPSVDGQGCIRMVRDLRRLYWLSDIVGILGQYIGAEPANDAASRLHRYALLAYRAIGEETADETRSSPLTEIVARGALSTLSQPLLTVLAARESDDEWKEDLKAAGVGWLRRVLDVNLKIHMAEEDDLIQKTDGRILENWDVSNPEAYEHYRRSHELERQGRIDEAMAELVKAVDLDPLDPANHFTLGSFKGGLGAKTGDETLIGEALEGCWMAATLDPNWILPWAEIGWILLKTGRAREAVEHLQRVGPEREPPDTRYYGALGTALGQLGDYAGSLAAFESSLKLNLDNLDTAVAAAEAALLAGDKLSSNRYRKLARHLGASPELVGYLELLNAVRTELSTAAIMAGEPKTAHLEALMLRNAGAATAHLAKGMAHFKEGELNPAKSELDTAIRLDPGNAATYLARGIIQGYMGRYDRVISDLSEAIRLSPGNAAAYHFRGMAHADQDALDSALVDLDEAIRLEPGNADAHRARGDCLRYKEEYGRAIADYDTALRLDPEHAPSHRGRGAALRMKGEFDQAIADYGTALRLRPEDPLTYRFRGDAYVATGNHDRAISDFNASLRLDDSGDSAYFGRGNAHLFLGRLDLAIADFSAAIERNPESARAFHGRGVTREVMGDSEGAENDYGRARKLGYDESA